jgi:phospholipase C
MIHKHVRSLTTTLTTACLIVSSLGDAWAAKGPNPAESYSTTTPIKHVVVIFQENVSFDHYFGTYPYANNPDSEPAFHGSDHQPVAGHR